MAATKDFRALVEQFYGLTLAYEEVIISRGLGREGGWRFGEGLGGI